MLEQAKLMPSLSLPHWTGAARFGAWPKVLDKLQLVVSHTYDARVAECNWGRQE